LSPFGLNRVNWWCVDEHPAPHVGQARHRVPVPQLYSPHPTPQPTCLVSTLTWDNLHPDPDTGSVHSRLTGPPFGHSLSHTCLNLSPPWMDAGHLGNCRHLHHHHHHHLYLSTCVTRRPLLPPSGGRRRCPYLSISLTVCTGMYRMCMCGWGRGFFCLSARTPATKLHHQHAYSSIYIVYILDINPVFPLMSSLGCCLLAVAVSFQIIHTFIEWFVFCYFLVMHTSSFPPGECSLCLTPLPVAEPSPFLCD